MGKRQLSLDGIPPLASITMRTVWVLGEGGSRARRLEVVKWAWVVPACPVQGRAPELQRAFHDDV